MLIRGILLYKVIFQKLVKINSKCFFKWWISGKMLSWLKCLDFLHDFLTGISQLCHQVPIKISSKSKNFLSSFSVYKSQCLQIGIGQMKLWQGSQKPSLWTNYCRYLPDTFNAFPWLCDLIAPKILSKSDNVYYHF